MVWQPAAMLLTYWRLTLGCMLGKMLPQNAVHVGEMAHLSFACVFACNMRLPLRVVGWGPGLHVVFEPAQCRCVAVELCAARGCCSRVALAQRVVSRACSWACVYASAWFAHFDSGLLCFCVSGVCMLGLSACERGCCAFVVRGWPQQPSLMGAGCVR
jgi:hypothetical protein